MASTIGLEEISRTLGQILAMPLNPRFFEGWLACGCKYDTRNSAFVTRVHFLSDDEGNQVEECFQCGATALIATEDRWVDGHYCDPFNGCSVCGSENSSYADGQ